MIKTIAYSIVLLIAIHSFGQQVNPQPQMSKQDYLQKSKRQKTTAFVMLAGGTALAVTGVVVFNHAYKRPPKKILS